MTPPDGPAPKRWAIRVCEGHKVQDCALCSVFDVLSVVPEAALRECMRLLVDAHTKLGRVEAWLKEAGPFIYCGRSDTLRAILLEKQP